MNLIYCTFIGEEMAYKIEYYCVNHKGKYRRKNQDNFFCAGTFLMKDHEGTLHPVKGECKARDILLVGVFDGMGGEQCGEVAAYLAAHIMSNYSFENMPEEEFLKYSKDANGCICGYGEEHRVGTMGTTAAVLCFHKKKVFLCNIGDSKIYLFAENKLHQISYDHVAVGMAGQKPPLLQYLGIPEDEMLIQPYIATGEYHEDDIYLVCSDGLTDMVTEEEIENLLQKKPYVNAAEELLDMALENGGKDNITIALCKVKKYNRLWG